MNEIERDFRAAWESASGQGFASRLARQSLEAAASESSELAPVLFELKNRHQAELDLHLEGGSVVDHATNAEQFADLIKGVADAVKEITKNALDRQRMSSGLMVLAPLPGSVRVVLRAAPPVEMDGQIVEARTETQDSNSLRLVATLIARANDDDPEGSIIEGLLAELPARARPGIRRVAKTVSKADWVVDGTLRRAQLPDETLHLEGAGARRLLTALDAREVERETVVIEGKVDGQRRSMGTMWFAPLVGAPIEAAVIDQDLLQTVAALGATSELAKATFTAVTQHLPGVSVAARRSYVLVAIQPVTNTDVELPL